MSDSRGGDGGGRGESRHSYGKQEYKVFVYGVHCSCPKSVIEDEFTRVGNVRDVKITSKGYAFVAYDNMDDAKKAVRELNGANIDGQEVKVELAKCSQPDDGGGRRYGGGGGGGGGKYRGGGGGGYYGRRDDGGYRHGGGGGGGRYGGGGGGRRHYDDDYDGDRRGGGGGGYHRRRDDY